MVARAGGEIFAGNLDTNPNGTFLNWFLAFLTLGPVALGILHARGSE
jgi:hypothetical protein